MFNNAFEEYVKCAVHHKEMVNEYTEKICEELTRKSPSNNEWYYFNGFFRVDVLKKDYGDYMEFIEDIVGCSYCHTMNTGGLTFMVSLTTLNMKL